MISTGERHIFTALTGDDAYACLSSACTVASPSIGSTPFLTYVFQSCTPCRSTPVAKRFEFRARPRAVRYPPYEPPHSPMRDLSTSARERRYDAAPSTSLYSLAPPGPKPGGSRKLSP